MKKMQCFLVFQETAYKFGHFVRVMKLLESILGNIAGLVSRRHLLTRSDELANMLLCVCWHMRYLSLN